MIETHAEGAQIISIAEDIKYNPFPASGPSALTMAAHAPGNLAAVPMSVATVLV